MTDEQVRAAWRLRFPDVTDQEFAALLPIVQGGGSPLRKMISAYRAGTRAARETTIGYD